MCRTREQNAADLAQEQNGEIPSRPWGNRRVFILTDAQAELIADALDIISPDDDRIEAQARAMALQFRANL